MTAAPGALARPVQIGAIEVRGASKVYGNGDVRALDPVDLQLEAGGFTAIVGPSGCGKTTLLKIIGDILTASGGDVLIDGEPAGACRRERRIGYVFQTPVLLPWRTVRENVLLPYDIGRRGRRARASIGPRLDEVLDVVGLTEFADKLPSQLSGGMQARVALARALIYEPSVLLMDEPFAALDELTRSKMALHLLDVVQRLGTSVVFVTHHIEEAVLLADRVLVMSARPGRIRRDIPVDLPRPRSLETRRHPLFRSLTDDLVADFHRDDDPSSSV
ncbi:ABC transporter ATP-binding protein [Blastococcus sp. SYSU DS0539]